MLTLAVSILTSAQAERQDRLSYFRQLEFSTMLFAGANINSLPQISNKVFWFHFFFYIAEKVTRKIKILL